MANGSDQQRITQIAGSRINVLRVESYTTPSLEEYRRSSGRRKDTRAVFTLEHEPLMGRSLGTLSRAPRSGKVVGRVDRLCYWRWQRTLAL